MARVVLNERIVRLEFGRLLHVAGKGKNFELVESERLHNVVKAFIERNPGFWNWEIGRLTEALRDDVEAW